jgi:hypothetical protein
VQPPNPPVVIGLDNHEREVLVTSTADAVPQHRFHLAHDSAWPLITALCVGGTFVGLIFHPVAVPIGAVAIIVAVSCWFWPTHEPEPIQHPARKGRPEPPVAQA